MLLECRPSVAGVTVKLHPPPDLPLLPALANEFIARDLRLLTLLKNVMKTCQVLQVPKKFLCDMQRDRWAGYPLYSFDGGRGRG
jgi:hypothetical protein